MSKKIRGTEEAWESGLLGEDPKHAVRAPLDMSELDKAVGLKTISIRMPETLLDDLKDIAKIHGLGYQPLMKQVLTRFVEAEKKRLLREEACRATGGEDAETCHDRSRMACG